MCSTITIVTIVNSSIARHSPRHLHATDLGGIVVPVKKSVVNKLKLEGRPILFGHISRGRLVESTRVPEPSDQQRAYTSHARPLANVTVWHVCHERRTPDEQEVDNPGKQVPTDRRRAAGMDQVTGEQKATKRVEVSPQGRG